MFIMNKLFSLWLKALPSPINHQGHNQRTNVSNHLQSLSNGFVYDLEASLG